MRRGILSRVHVHVSQQDLGIAGNEADMASQKFAARLGLSALPDSCADRVDIGTSEPPYRMAIDRRPRHRLQRSLANHALNAALAA